jgi:hypothetical protein
MFKLRLLVRVLFKGFIIEEFGLVVSTEKVLLALPQFPLVSLQENLTE